MALLWATRIATKLTNTQANLWAPKMASQATVNTRNTAHVEEEQAVFKLPSATDWPWDLRLAQHSSSGDSLSDDHRDQNSPQISLVPGCLFNSAIPINPDSCTATRYNKLTRFAGHSLTNSDSHLNNPTSFSNPYSHPEII